MIEPPIGQAARRTCIWRVQSAGATHLGASTAAAIEPQALAAPLSTAAPKSPAPAMHLRLTTSGSNDLSDMDGWPWRDGRSLGELPVARRDEAMQSSAGQSKRTNERKEITRVDAFSRAHCGGQSTAQDTIRRQCLLQVSQHRLRRSSPCKAPLNHSELSSILAQKPDRQWWNHRCNGERRRKSG